MQINSPSSKQPSISNTSFILYYSIWNNRSRLRPNRYARSYLAALTSGETDLAVVLGKETYHRKSRLRAGISKGMRQHA